MPKASKQTASTVQDMGVMEGRYEEFGGYTVGFETFREDADATPMFKGLPDDRCQSPHWGYVARGRVTFRFAEGEITLWSDISEDFFRDELGRGGQDTEMIGTGHRAKYRMARNPRPVPSLVECASAIPLVVAASGPFFLRRPRGHCHRGCGGLV